MLKELLLQSEACRNIINKERPFSDPFVLNLIKDFYRVPIVWSSNAIEGNTLSEGETEILIRDGITSGGHLLREAMEAIGGNEAYSYMYNLIDKDKLNSINNHNIREFHRLCCYGQSDVSPGEYRNVNVFITGLDKELPSHEEVPRLMESFSNWLAENQNMNPIAYASEAHARLASIHPFIDGNGRTCRLLMNSILIRNGYLPIAITPFLRSSYIDSLRSYQLGKGSIDPLTEFISKVEIQTQKDFARLLHIDLSSAFKSKLEINTKKTR